MARARWPKAIINPGVIQNPVFPSRTGARRSLAIVAAAAVLGAPLFVAGPAAAADFTITSVDFGQDVVNVGESVPAYFGGDPTRTSVSDSVCFSEYLNEAVLSTAEVTELAATANFDRLTGSLGFVEDDVYTVAYYASNGGVCTAPLVASDSYWASITVGAVPVVPVVPACVDCTVTAAPVSLKQGVAVDMIVPLQLTGAWDWSKAGWIMAGPQSGGSGTVNPFQGLAFETVESPGFAPKLRIVGTPIYSGSFNAGLAVGDGSNYAESSLILNIAAAAGSSAVTIDAATGAPIAGAPVNVVMSGLQPGAAYSVTVRSTPVTIGSGTVAIDGVLARSFTIPAGLEAGRHSVTLSSTLANGTTVNAVLYFTVSATGTLVSVSLTAPALVATGVDAVPAVVAAGSLLLLGSAFAAAAVYRRRSIAA